MNKIDSAKNTGNRTGIHEKNYVRG